MAVRSPSMPGIIQSRNIKKSYIEAKHTPLNVQAVLRTFGSTTFWRPE
jgi:hypothetical protein